MSPAASSARAVGWGLGLAAAGIGAALGAAAGVAAERATVGKPLTGRRPPPLGEVPLGSLRGRAQRVPASDGTLLHVEVDEPSEGASGRPTVVLTHGYALNLDAWHYQRLALRGTHRLVLWDQRGHGRSERGPRGSATIEQVGDDLLRVVEATAPQGPLVLVGHSMGGMTVMSAVAARPDLVAERVIGVGLVATSAGGLATNDFGLAGVGRLFQRVAPGAAAVLARTPRLVERTRRIGSDLEQVLVRHYSFASDVDPRVVRFVADMIASTQIEVISDFLPAFSTHDKLEALSALQGCEVLVVAAEDDYLTPAAHSEDIVRALPAAEHVVIRDAGHMVMLEHPHLVDEQLLGLLHRAQRAAESGEAQARAATGSRPRRTVREVAARRRARRGAA